MKLKYIFFISCFGILIVACTKEKTLQEYMIDSWQTTYLKIEMPTYEKSDSLEVFEDKFDNNPELIAQSKYNADGTFNAWFINKENKRISDSEGKWHVENDSLFVEFFYVGRNMKISYHITKTNEGFIGKSNFDWDNDGEFDDALTMKTKRIKLD
ncbi:hypothetical protein KO506_09560 [Polaribacter vadi]|uniref:hypothetical protein n=1 Tax=Polaribacter TaxID=52959 RepID=UPI001C088A11|nr:MULTISPECIES: hypothetical protein [Polaribacter]MBU3011648.1 hypothetical protein [Polaribacter vadi]MDO6741461.1 hypothetical protein [Polaribacter sp. 1_MG-2023]